MKLQPLPQSRMTAAVLRRMAKDLILQAEALEAETASRATKKHTPFLFSKENRKKRKQDLL